MRLFFAAFPDSETRARFASAARALELDDCARRVPDENHHMTLAFLGEAAESRLTVLRTIGAARRAAAPFTVRFDACEHWPKAEVVAATASACPPSLEKLSQALRSDLLQLRLALEPEPFRPHVTLARKVSQAPVFKAMSEIGWMVREFHLVRSDRAAGGAVYTVLDTWPLLDTP